MKKIIITITLVCLAVVLALEPISLAWMSDNGMSSPVGITSNVHKSYFESGNGTASDPFEIARPIQLYYFAWLQYLGYFNEDGDDADTDIDTYYFYISDDLNMDGYVLPPIGTQNNPFLGNLDGKNHTIKNLTVQNVKGDLGNLYEPPQNAGNTLSGVEIVGFFGVIGELAEGDYSYDNSANQVTNLVLENLTVQTQTDNALIGLAAGYVNGTVSGVGVVSSTVDIQSTGKLGYTSNFSDYSLIGYCTDTFKANVNVMDVNLTQPQTVGPYEIIPGSSNVGGSATGWGASVAMKDIYGWLTDIKTGVGQLNEDYIIERTDVVMLDENPSDAINPLHVTTSTTKLEAGGGNIWGGGNNYQKTTATVPGLGSFVFSQMNGDYNFMSGGVEVTEYQYKYESSTVTAYYITDGTNYLCFDGSDIHNVEIDDVDENTTKWYASNGTNGGALYTVVDNVVYYLTLGTNNALTVTSNVDPTNPPTWTVTNNELRLNSRTIKCTNGTWASANTTTSTTSYLIYNGSNYLAVDGVNGVKNVTNSSAATVWTMTGDDSNRIISTVINGTKYYLSAEEKNNSVVLTLTETSTTWSYSSSRYSIRLNNTNYYFKYDNGWVCATNRNTGSNPSRSEVWVNNGTPQSAGTLNKLTYSKSTYIDNSFENYYYNADGSKQVVDTAGITYFPLSADVEVENGQVDFTISENNKGYIISTEWGDASKSEHDNYGNIRISRYNTSGNLDNYTTPYTITYKTNGIETIAAGQTRKQLAEKGLRKYYDCYGKFQGSVSGGDCYGLHFMTASVTKSNTVTINGTEMPTNCIDFYLDEPGYINFFAGTYYTVMRPYNNSFFSIYQIIRNADGTIKEIKEINKIYAVLENGYINEDIPYVYTYTDGTVSVGETVPTGYTEVFDCAWITNTSEITGWTENAAYYFEVPVNAGEYAIGSTAGKTGAYLVYLDLAANAEIHERNKEYEEITEIRGSGSYPLGVELLQQGTSYDLSKIDPSKSAFAAISNATGAITFTKTDANTVTATRDPVVGNINAAYIGPGRYLKDGNISLSMPADTTLIQRTTYRDYNLNTGDTIVTIITVTTVNNGTPTETYEQYINGVLSTDDLSTFTKDSEEYETGGGNLVSLSFSYTSTDVSLSYSYDSTENKYYVTITSDTALSVTATMLDTSSTAATVFINGTQLAKNANPQTVSVAATSGT